MRFAISPGGSSGDRTSTTRNGGSLRGPDSVGHFPLSRYSRPPSEQLVRKYSPTDTKAAAMLVTREPVRLLQHSPRFPRPSPYTCTPCSDKRGTRRPSSASLRYRDCRTPDTSPESGDST